MISALRRMGFLSRLVVALLAVAFVLAPFHAHDAAAHDKGADVGKSVIVLSDSEHGRTDTSPDGPSDLLKGDCIACIVMKQIEIPVVRLRSDLPQTAESVVYFVAEADSPQRMIAEHFRPPCSVPV